MKSLDLMFGRWDTWQTEREMSDAEHSVMDTRVDVQTHSERPWTPAGAVGSAEDTAARGWTSSTNPPRRSDAPDPSRSDPRRTSTPAPDASAVEEQHVKHPSVSSQELQSWLNNTELCGTTAGISGRNPGQMLYGCVTDHMSQNKPTPQILDQAVFIWIYLHSGCWSRNPEDSLRL